MKTGSRLIYVKRKGQFVHQTVGFALGTLGIWVLGLTVPLPNISSQELGQELGKNLGQVISQPVFYETLLALEPKQEDFLTTLVRNRWGFLEYAPKESVTIPVIPPVPQAILPQEALEQEEELPPPLAQEEDFLQTNLLPQGNWEPRTMVGTESHLYYDGIYVANSGRVAVASEELAVISSITLPVTSQPQILIYHSHGTESYSQTEGYTYEESDPFRTTDMNYNITAVGAAMAEVFREAGYEVIHDTTLHDYPDYNSSYENSGKMLTEYLESYPSLELIFDVHRDALANEEGIPYQLISQDMAQVMLVVGTDGGGYRHDNWRDNFTLALTLQEGLLAYGDFVRPITLRSTRFNQHLSTGALLLEIGGHGNTFPQALAAGICFAESVVETLSAS